VEGTISFTAQGQQVNIPAVRELRQSGEIPGARNRNTAAFVPGCHLDFCNNGWQQTTLYLNAGDKFYVDYARKLDG